MTVPRSAGVLLALSGLFNVITAAMFVVPFVWFVVGALWLIPFAVGVFQIAEGFKILRNEPAPRARTLAWLGVASGVLNANPIPIVLAVAAARRLPASPAAPGLRLTPSAG
jgi:hypothetical protein